MVWREHAGLDDAADPAACIAAVPHDHLDLVRSPVGVEAMKASSRSQAQDGARAGQIQCRLTLRPVVERMVS
jgi:hypothetical protein